MRYPFIGAACLCALILFPSTSAFSQTQKQHLSLDDILHHVNEDNPSLKAAREELRRTKELYPQAKAGWRPSVNASADIYATDIDSSNFGNADGATTKDLSLSVNQPIWRGGRTFAETDRAQELIKAGEASLLKAQQSIFMDAATAYMSVLRDREILKIRQKNEDILMQELHAAWTRVDIGTITNTDVYQAKSRLARAKSIRIDAQRDLDISSAEFEQIIGMPPPKNLKPPHTTFPFPKTQADMIKLAEKQNPDIWIIKYEHSAAKYNVKATFRELFPQISAYASYNKQYDPQPGIIDDSRVNTIGLRATISLYEGGATRSRVREAKKEAKRLEYTILEVKRRIKQEIIRNLSSYNAAKSNTESRQVEIEAARLALKGVKEESMEGQRSVLDVLDADQEHIDAQASLTQARYNETLNQYALAATLGLLGNKNTIPSQ